SGAEEVEENNLSSLIREPVRSAVYADWLNVEIRRCRTNACGKNGAYRLQGLIHRPAGFGGFPPCIPLTHGFGEVLLAGHKAGAIGLSRYLMQRRGSLAGRNAVGIVDRGNKRGHGGGVAAEAELPYCAFADPGVFIRQSGQQRWDRLLITPGAKSFYRAGPH